MATFDYVGLKNNTVIPNLIRFGIDITLSRLEDITDWEKRYDAVEMKYYWYNTTTTATQDDPPAGTPTPYTSVGVLTKYTNDEIDNTNIKRGDMKLLTIDIPEPTLGDVITIGTTDWGVVNSEQISPDNTTIVLWKVQVRK